MKKSKGTTTAVVPMKSKKATVSEKLATLSATIREYFFQLRTRQPEYTLRFDAILVGENGAKREHMVNVPSLIAAIVTAQGLGKEIKLRADTSRDGGTIYVEFYSPVRVANGQNLLS